MMRVSFNRIATALAVLALTAAPVLAKKSAPRPSGTVKIERTAVGLGVGGSFGGGTLTYKGKNYAFDIEGIEIGSIGFSRTSANGSVYNLNKLSDFSGTYTAVGASATVGGGGSVDRMRNQNGVVINLGGTSRGLQMQAGVDGLKVKLKE